MHIQQHKHPGWLGENPSIGILLLRIFLGSRLLYGVVDNILSWERMLEFSAFLEQHHFPWPTFSAVHSVYIQAICALLVLIGYQTRIAALLLGINFLIALFMVHLPAGDTVEGMTPALAMLFASLTLLFTGAKDISLDRYYS
ncbi:MAG: DoxX family protein [Saprospiraceae bacterium]|nr:DoxX family protein [Saprospiraceae bacterium]